MARIIAGTAGGRRISTPSGDATRPTTDRVREAFFSSLAAWVGRSEESAETQLRGLSFLDLFAGSGAVGLEAASRGAAPVVLVEKVDAVARLVRENVRAAGLDARVERSAVDRFLTGPASAFDVVWLDPPYALPDAELNGLLDLVVRGGWLAADALVVVERSSRSAAPMFPRASTRAEPNAPEPDAPEPDAPEPDAWVRRYGETILHHAQY